MYSIFEIIKDSKVKMQETSTASKKRVNIFEVLDIKEKEKKNFRSLANNIRNPYEGMRHGSSLTKGDKKDLERRWNPDSLSWAIDFINKVTRRWVNHQFGIVIMKPCIDEDKIINKSRMSEDSIKQIKFRTASEKYEDQVLNRLKKK